MDLFGYPPALWRSPASNNCSDRGFSMTQLCISWPQMSTALHTVASTSARNLFWSILWNRVQLAHKEINDSPAVAEEAQAGSKMLPTLNTVERCSNTATDRSVREMLVIQCHSGFCYTVPQTRPKKVKKRKQLSKVKQMTLKTASRLVRCAKCKFLQHGSWKCWASWQHWQPEFVHTKVPRDQERRDSSTECLPQSPTILNIKKRLGKPSQTCQPTSHRVK